MSHRNKDTFKNYFNDNIPAEYSVESSTRTPSDRVPVASITGNTETLDDNTDSNAKVRVPPLKKIKVEDPETYLPISERIVLIDDIASTTTDNTINVLPEVSTLPKYHTTVLTSILRSPQKYPVTTNDTVQTATTVTTNNINYSTVVIDKATLQYYESKKTPVGQSKKPKKHVHVPGLNCYTVTPIKSGISKVFQLLGHVAFSDVTTYYSDFGDTVNKRTTAFGSYLWILQGHYFKKVFSTNRILPPRPGSIFPRLVNWHTGTVDRDEICPTNKCIHPPRTITHVFNTSEIESTRYKYYRYKPEIISPYAHVFLTNPQFSTVYRDSMFGAPPEPDTRPYNESWQNKDRSNYTPEDMQHWRQWVYYELYYRELFGEFDEQDLLYEV